MAKPNVLGGKPEINQLGGGEALPSDNKVTHTQFNPAHATYHTFTIICLRD